MMKSPLRARPLAIVAALLGTLACGAAADDEHFTAYGRVTRMTAICSTGHPDLEAIRRRFDSVRPGLKGRGYSREELLRMLRALGGVLIEYSGRRYHSKYMFADTRNWLAPEEPVYAEAAFTGPPPGWGTVYVLHPIWKGHRRIDGVFYPWESTVPGLACR